MAHRLAADLTLLLHLFFIGFVIFGGLLSLHSPSWSWLHIPAMLWGVWVEWTGKICPLTPLENYLRKLASEQQYPESFVEHYLIPLIYPGQLTVAVQWFLGSTVLIANTLIYYYVFKKRSKQQDRVDD